MLVGGAVVLVVELLDKFFMRFIGQMQVGHYVSVIIDFSINSLVNFEFLNIFTLPQLCIGIIIGILLLIIVNILVEEKTVND